MVGPLWRQFFCSLSPEVQAAETFEDRCRLVAASIRLRQLRDNRSYWDKRLARIEPAGAIVLWPQEVA